MAELSVVKNMLCGIMFALLMSNLALGMQNLEEDEEGKLPQNQGILDFEVVVSDLKGEPVSRTAIYLAN